jgi:hypothetical protein
MEIIAAMGVDSQLIQNEVLIELWLILRYILLVHII